MTILSKLREGLVENHTLDIKPISDYKSFWNKEHKDIKHVFTIHIYHPDKPAGFFFSRYAKYYADLIKQVLDNHSNGKMYELCCTECGNNIEFDVVYNRYRVLTKK